MKNIDIVKADLIAQIDKRLEDKIIEPANADLLKKLIQNSETTNEAMMIAELGTTYKRTGFHFDKRLEKLGSDIKYLTKNENLSFETNPNELTHKLIIGDNYDALQQLLITHRGKIDIIYIDPPYGCNDMGEFAKTNYTNSITRDNLLSMLYPRLQLAKQLLSDEGVIFCSIDDKNQAYLKGLFDEVFGEENFYGTFIQKKGNTQNDTKQIQKNHEYILCYVKNNNDSLILSYDNFIKEKVYEDNYTLGRDTGASSGHDKLIERANLGYTIYYIESTGNGETGNHNKLIERANLLNTKYGNFNYYISKDNKTFIHAIAVMDYDKNLVKDNSIEEDVYTDIQELLALGYKKIRPPKRKGNKLGRWTWGIDTFQEYWNNNEVLIKKGNKKVNVIKKIFLKKEDISVIDDKKYYLKHNVLPLQSIIDINNSNGTSILSGNKGIIPGCAFSNPKNPDMLKYLFKAKNDKNAIILDFFAGSGTSGQAVLDLNREDGGSRKFILCTNNEITNMNPNGIAYDITSKRLKRVMTGECYDGTKDFPWAKKNEPYGNNLDVYEIKNVNNSEQTEGKSPFDVINEECYGLPKFASLREKISWICNNFENTQKYIEEEEKHASGNN